MCHIGGWLSLQGLAELAAQQAGQNKGLSVTYRMGMGPMADR